MLNIKPGQIAKIKKVEMKYTQSGTALCTFSLYTATKKRGANGDKPEDYDIHWFNGVAFKDVATMLSGLSDGTKIVLNSAAIQYESWETKDKQKRTGYKLLVFDAAVADGAARVQAAVRGEVVPPSDFPFADDDIPF